ILIGPYGQAAKIDMNIKNSIEYTPLMYAVIINQEEIVELLIGEDGIKAGINVNEKNKYGKTAFIYSIIGNKLGIVKIFIGEYGQRAGIDVNVEDIDGNTPVMYAANENKIEILKELIKACAKSSTKLFKKGPSKNVNLNAKNKNGDTVLMSVVINKKIIILKELIGENGRKAGIDINAKDENRNTPLMRAVIDGYVKVVEELVGPDGQKAKIDVNAADKDGNTPLMRTVIDDKIEIAKILIGPDGQKAKININEINDLGDTALTLGVIHNRPEIVKLLIGQEGIKSGIDIEKKNKNNKTALDLAKENNKEVIVKEFAEFMNKNVELLRKNKEDRYIEILVSYKDNTNEEHVAEELKFLIDGGIKNINSKNKDGYTFFMLAVIYKHIKIIDLLIGDYGEKAGINLDKQSGTSTGSTAFLYSVQRNLESGDTEIMDILINSKKVDIDKKNKKGDTPLMFAVGNVKILKKLIQAKAKLDIRGSHDESTALIQTASDSERVESLKELIKAGANPNLENGYKQTALICAANINNVKAVDELIKAGANLNLTDSKRKTALSYAVIRNNKEIVDKLIAAKADPDIGPNGQTALILAEQHNRVEIQNKLKEYVGNREKNTKKLVELLDKYKTLKEEEILTEIEGLLKEIVDINLKNKERMTLLTYAAMYNHIKVTKLLLNSGADINLTEGNDDYTPLIVAANYGQEKIVDILIKVPGIELNKVTKHKETALTLAVMRRKNKIVEILMQANGIDPNVLCSRSDGDTVLVHAIKHGQKEIVKILLKYREATKLDLNKISKNGYTALDWAYRGNNITDREEIIKLLEEAGAEKSKTTHETEKLVEILDEYEKLEEETIKTKIEDLSKKNVDINVKDKEGRTALILAAQHGHIQVTELLLNSGADVNLTENFGHTALMMAVIYAHEGIVEILTKAPGIELNKGNRRKETALMMALTGGKKNRNKIAEMLATLPGININAISENSSGPRAAGEKKTALDFACDNYDGPDREELIRLLINNGAKKRDELITERKK
ncbi:MAG: ankyrin repeat domain-containing protein, partial [Firmicutes bacterium]|nr:ankyrin repeat domain-containing protein [Bacillota bacterium]